MLGSARRDFILSESEPSRNILLLIEVLLSCVQRRLLLMLASAQTDTAVSSPELLTLCTLNRTWLMSPRRWHCVNRGVRP